MENAAQRPDTIRYLATIKQAIKSAKEGPWDKNLATAALKRTRPIVNEDDSEINSDEDDNSSSSDSSSDEDEASLSRNTPPWILTDPVIPDQQHQFSHDDYTKSYSLKALVLLTATSFEKT